MLIFINYSYCFIGIHYNTIMYSTMRYAVVPLKCTVIMIINLNSHDPTDYCLVSLITS